MFKINQIQYALKELDGGAFQKLADQYLHRKGLKEIHSSGSVAGSNKVRKGTPDSFFLTDDGKYIFCEFTTQQSKVFEKFSADIAKCLDKEKTGIDPSKIKEIVLCCTSELSLKELNNLHEQCGKPGINLIFFGLSAISYDLLQKYPDIAKDHLNIEVDTGQIVSLEKFISFHEKSKYSSSLQTKFFFREDEKKELNSLVHNNSIVIISGKSGVGKTRIAIECFREFMEINNTYKAYCIFNMSYDLFEDIKSYFSDAGDYLIFVDDANRISGFQIIVQQLQTIRSDQNFKIIVTVRDYALDHIMEKCQDIADVEILELKPFTDDEIGSLLKDEFNILNPLYLERIVDFSKGNPRIAVMAADIVQKVGTFESIKDISELYDAYFSSINKDLDLLKDENTKKVAGIVSFFRFIDSTNKELLSEIDSVFNISPDTFWQASEKLHTMEVFDFYENEIIKVSDQILSTYLFYLVFFKEQLIDFSLLLTHFFPQYKHRLIDAINPLLSYFNHEEIKKIMYPKVEAAWNAMQGEKEEVFIQFLDIFWYLKPTETLLFILDKIDKIKALDLPLEKINFTAESNSSLPKFMSTLPRFWVFGHDQLGLSLDLLFRYAKKQPQDAPSILHLLINEYGFRSESNLYDYFVQHTVVDKLLKLVDEGRDEYFTNIFIALSENYLKTHFSTTKTTGRYQIVIEQFDLFETQSLTTLREKILKQLINLYQNEKNQDQILNLLRTLFQIGPDMTIGNILNHDSKILLSFFGSSLDPKNLRHSILVLQYIRFLKCFDIEIEKPVEDMFQSPIYSLYDLLTDKSHKAKGNQSINELREYKIKKLTDLVSSYSVDDYSKLFHQLQTIMNLCEDHSKWQVQEGIDSIFDILLKRDINLFWKALKAYLEQGEYLELRYPGIWLSSLLRKFETEEVLDLINQHDYATKNKWLMRFYQVIPAISIQKEHIESLKKLYKESEFDHFNYDVDYLLKYESFQNGSVAELVEIVIERAKKEPKFAQILSILFDAHTVINKDLSLLFLGKFDLLENAYLAIDRNCKNADHDGKGLAMLLDNDTTFIDRLLKDQFSRKVSFFVPDDNRDYSFIWLREDFIDIMNRITKAVFEYKLSGHRTNHLKTFFVLRANNKANEIITLKQKEFLLKEIESEFENNNFMVFLFSVITYLSLQVKLECFNVYLKKNQNIEDFRNLPLYLASSSWSNSSIPMLEYKIDLLEKIMDLCNSVDLLTHKHYIEQRIKYTRYEIQDEKKRDFTEEK